jgi:DNA-binding transcriptional ArsR family regulator
MSNIKWLTPFQQTASEYLRALENIGVLKVEKQGREVLYKHPALLAVLAA